MTLTQQSINFIVCGGLALWAAYLFYSRRLLKPSKEWVELKIAFDRLEAEFNTLTGPLREMALGSRVLQEHATERFQREILLLRETMFDTYRDVVNRGGTLDAAAFIERFFSFCIKNPPFFRKKEKELTDAFLG